MVLGIDIHPVYQEHINWESLSSNVKYIWLKVSDGGSAYRKTVNGRLYTPDSHAAGMKKTGAACGAYHYAQFSPSPESQADVFDREIRRLGLTSLPPALDLEAPFTPNSTAKEFAYRFLVQLKKKGWSKVVIYSYTTMAQAIRPDLWDITGLITWIARPGRVGDLGVYKGRTDVQQFTSGGSITGIQGLVDCNETLNNNLLGGLNDMDWNETREYWNPAHNYSEIHAVGEVEGSNFYRVSDTYRNTEYIRSKLDILAGELSDDEVNILSAFRSGIPAVFSREQMDELKTAIREAQTESEANAVVDAFWRRLAPGTATNPNAEHPTGSEV